MITQAQNDELTLVGQYQPMGRVLRQYWMPAALSEELAQERPVVPVRLLGEDLVLFRNASQTLGLIGRRCLHRGADLSYGRLEPEGLRCPFHGWCFAPDGRCLEQPAEPDTSTMYRRVRATSYPVVERNGIVWAYLGEGPPPSFPQFDCFRAPGSHVFAFKGLWQCNWLQATEIGIDPAHASFLHRFLQDDDPEAGYGQQFRDRAAQSDMPMTRVLREFPRPHISVEETPYGMRLVARRELGEGRVHVRVTNQIFPCAITIPMSNEMTITQWHVPIDDRRCYWYSMFTSFDKPVDKALMRAQRLKEHTLPDYAPIKNAANRYGYDAAEQRTNTYTGMGSDINVHDQWAVESMGAIADRRVEHLASSDIGIVRFRKQLSRAIARLDSQGSERGDDALNGDAAQGPIAVDAIAQTQDWEQAWRLRDAQRRRACPWDALL